MRTILPAIVAVLSVPGRVCAVDVPLIVWEVNGMERIGNPVNSGVPLPKGAVKDPSELRLIDAHGNVIPASIEARSRWLEDGSLQWVTIHFVTDLEAGGTMRCRLITSNAPTPASLLDVKEERGTITVTTGPARFVIPTDRLAPFAQVDSDVNLVLDAVWTAAIC